jgi:hypothetical protein
VTDSCEHVNVPSDSIKGVEFPDHLSNTYISKKDISCSVKSVREFNVSLFPRLTEVVRIPTVRALYWVKPTHEGVSRSFRTESITKYMLTTTNTRWEATQRVMAAKLTTLTHKIAIKLHLVAESSTICSSRSRRPVRKLLDTRSYFCPTYLPLSKHGN